MAKVHKDWRPLVKRLQALGFSVVPGGKHNLIKNIHGKTVATIPATPSDHRSLKNAVSDLRKLGVLPPKNKSHLRAAA